MKKLMKYAYVVLAGVLAMTVTSCKDTYEYDGVGAQDPGAFLSVDATELKYAADDEQVLKVTLIRTNSEAAENISLTTNNSHFQVPSSVSFNAGENSVKVLLGNDKYDYSNANDGDWIYFDYVPEEKNIRGGEPAVTGRFCVIGSALKEDALKELFNIG